MWGRFYVRSAVRLGQIEANLITAALAIDKCGAKLVRPASESSKFTPYFVLFRAAVIEYSGSNLKQMWGKKILGPLRYFGLIRVIKATAGIM
jgi:hypothetical protein